MTRRYNEEVADGKWNRITDYKPGYKNGSTVFHAPVTARLETDGREGMGVIIEGGSVPLKPTKGILPLVTTRGSVIYLNSNEATLSGEMIRAIDKDESQYLIWPGNGRDREVRTPEWDTIPYTIANDSKAVFDFYFGEPSGGLHKLYLSVDFPDHKSNSWWIKCNEQAPLPVTAAPGRYQQFQVSDVVLNNGWNRITLYPGKSGAKLYDLMLKQEGEQFMPESTTENLLPLFHSCIPATAFIDLYAFGIKPERWSATTSHPWILLSKEKGYLADGAERIFITVNANKKEIAGINEGFIEIHGEAQHYRIRVNLLHNNTIKSTGTFWEDNGVIVLPALNYSRKKESRFAIWKSIRGLGRSGGAMMVTPFENDHTDSLEMGYVEAPLLEYELTVVKGGDAVVLIEAVPAFPTDKNQPMKCAISIDNGPMQEIIFEIGNESSLTWQKSLLEHRMIGNGNMHLSPGHHTFKVWGIDPSLNIDRLLINFG